MRPTIFEAMEVGLLHVPFHPDNPFLFCLFWLCFFIGIIVLTMTALVVISTLYANGSTAWQT
ncbi:MAG: hypothetical protein IJ969_04940, partial [Anaerotignum sp.]|nr:hypothetical protein [Anaerotignum sp.]